MSDSLRAVSDAQILTNTDTIIAQDRKLTVRLLVHLHEIERRKLYLKRGYGSMFDYCTAHLRLSEPAAVRRIKTARCLACFPELHGMLESGHVNLTTVSLMARILKPGNSAVLLARVRGKSKREVEAIVAEYEPRAALPADRVRTIVVTAPSTALSPFFASGQKTTVSGDGKKSSTPELAKDNRRAGDCEKAPASTVPAVTTLERRAVVQFSAREIVMSKLDRVRLIAAHRLPGNASFEQVIEFLVDYFTAREDPEVRHERRESRKQKKTALRRATAQPDKLSRRIPTQIRDQIFARDQARCTYVSPGGKRCGSTHVLQIDHVKPVARGGAATLENLRLLCAQHNRLEAERLMGCAGQARRDRAP